MPNLKWPVPLNTTSSPPLLLTPFSVTVPKMVMHKKSGCLWDSCLVTFDMSTISIITVEFNTENVISVPSIFTVFYLFIYFHFSFLYNFYKAFVYSLPQFIIPHNCPRCHHTRVLPRALLVAHCSLLPSLPSSPPPSRGASTLQSPEYKSSGGCLTFALHTLPAFSLISFPSQISIIII